MTNIKEKAEYNRDKKNTRPGLLSSLIGYAMIKVMAIFENHRAWSLRTHPEEEKIVSVLAAALAAVDPEKAVLNVVQRDRNHLTVGQTHINLDAYRRVFIIGAGKASFLMAKALSGLIGDKLAKGAVISKAVSLSNFLPGYPSVRILKGGHPIPDGDSIQSTQVLIEMVKELGEQDLVLCLISGGGSALLTRPVQGVTLEQLRNLTRTLLACGASVDEINAIRKHLDEVKGGRLAGLVYPARLVTLILSDVIGSPLEVIASGPTVADPTTFQDALNIIEKYQVMDIVPPAVIEIFKKGILGELPETVKPGDEKIKSTVNLIVGSNLQAAEASVAEARRLGFHCLLLTTRLQGEARVAGRFLAAILREIAETGHPLPRPACLVVGGETTVVIKGEGSGGRNQELALGAVKDLDDVEKVALITLATDGEDGPTDAAGAIVTGSTAKRAETMGLNTQAYLDDNNSYAYFKMLDDQIRTGSTGTNVNDLAFLFAF